MGWNGFNSASVNYSIEDGTGHHQLRRSYETYAHSMWDVMSGSVPPETFKDKIVLVGATARQSEISQHAFQGRRPTWVSVHASILDNLLHNGEQG
jgi:CHASE2 domain-containing sensor protein